MVMKYLVLASIAALTTLSCDAQKKCASLAEKECILAPECTRIMGKAYFEQSGQSKPGCLGELSYYGCTKGIQCGSERSTHCDANGQAYRTWGDCALSSWQSCEPPFLPEETAETCGPPKPEDRCETLDESACKKDSECQVTKGKVLLKLGEGDCVGSTVSTGCIQARDCEDSEFYLCTPEGARYWTNNGCFPSSWKECEAAQGSESIDDLPDCPGPSVH